MSTNWYTTWTGGSSGNGSSCYNNDSNQNDGYENVSIGNNVGNFIGNRGGFNLGYGATENYGNFRRNYEARYGEGAVSNNRENYSDNFRGGYGQRYGDNASSSYRSNYRVCARGIDRSSYRGNYEQKYAEDTRSNNRSSYGENYGQRYGEDVRNNDSINSRRNYEQRYGEVVRSNSRGRYEQRHGGNVRSNDSSNYRGNYEQRYGENVRSNDCANYSENFRGSFKPSFGENARDSHCAINYSGINRERYKKVKTEPYQNAYEKDYIEKDIKEKSERMKQEAKEKDFRCNLGRLKEMTSQERVQNYVTNQIKEEVFSDINLEKEIIKTEIADKNVTEINEKYHITKEEATNLVAERQAQEKKKEHQKRLKEKKKKKMAEKNVTENNENHHITKEEATNLAESQAQEKKKERQKRFKEIRQSKKEKRKKKMALKKANARQRDEEKDKAIFDKEVKAVTRWDQYACLKPECLETFQVWGDARRHMRQGCLPGTRTKKRWRFTVKPNMAQSREKAQNQRGKDTPKLKPVPDENEEKLVEAARNFYAEKRNRTKYPTHKQVVWHLRNTYRGFGVPPARIHQIVKSLSNP